MVKEETGVEVRAWTWLESRADVTSVKSPWMELASAHWFSVKSVANLAISYTS